MVNPKPVYNISEEIRFHALPFPDTEGLVDRYEWYLGVPTKRYPLISSSNFYVYTYPTHNVSVPNVSWTCV